ncbi:MAG: alanine-zipper protein [Gammaproteobacteria bacterium]|nr:alanine-zipper protein [Gammaproteobacteria bacterium]
MSISITRALTALVGAGVIALSAGCATDDQLFKARVEAKEALGAAQRAEAAANRADSAAAGAALDADQAMRTANEAKACCTENTEKIDRAARKVGSN